VCSYPAVQRGVATTSVAAKKAEKSLEAPEPSEPEPPIITKQVESGNQQSSSAEDDWEHEQNAGDTALQSLVDRLQEKGEREVARILKAS
jgi:ATP-dependent RNA helicase DHX29